MADFYCCKTQMHRQQKLTFLPFLVIFISFASGASFREEPMSKEVSVGESVTLHCAVDGNLEGVSVFWWNINASRALTDNTRIGARYLSQDQIDRYSITGDPSQGEFNFHISSATYADIATYSCRIWDGTLWQFSRQVNLNVVRVTPECTLQANLPVDVGNVIILSCRSYSTDPNVQLHWLSKGRLIQSLPNLSSTTLSVIQHTLTEQDYDVPFMCLQATEYQRKACQIVPLHRQISVIVRDQITTVYDGDVASFQCTTGFAKTSLTYSWFVDGVLQKESTDVLELSVQTSNNGTIVTCKVRDSVSGLSGENDATLLVIPRPSTTPTDPMTKNKATTVAETKPSGLVSNSEKTKTTAVIGGTIPQAASVDIRSNTEVPPLGEIGNPGADGSEKSSPSENTDFMTAVIIGSLLVGFLLVTLIVVVFMFLAWQSRQRRRDQGDGDNENAGSNPGNMPLGMLGVVTTDDEGYLTPLPRQMKDKQGGIKETNEDYAVLDLNDVEDAAYAIPNVTTSTTLSDTTPLSCTARPSQHSNKSPRPLTLTVEPKNPSSTPKPHTYMTRIEYNTDLNNMTIPVNTSPAVGPRHVDAERVSYMLGDDDYTEISDIAQESSSYQ
ncbi:uncharacterized protein [Amphiura filiformis]|uniref:uncharacterized protein n=1 Tax=Amphiura filiformis TaxID=82378 RepID=UPI003B20C2EA